MHILYDRECQLEALSLERSSSSLFNLVYKRAKLLRDAFRVSKEQEFIHKMNMIFSLMQLFGLIMILNFTAVQGCRFDMKFNERVRVCSQCKNKEVVGKFHCKKNSN